MGTPMLVDSDAMDDLCKRLAAAEAGSLSEQDIQDLIGPHTDPTELCPAQAVVETGLTYINPQIHRRGYRGVDEAAARCDHIQENRRINPTPLTPDITFAGVGEMLQMIVLDRWSGNDWVEYAFRGRVEQDVGTGWGFFIVPNLAGFQRPIITTEGSYDTTSAPTQIDTDDTANQGNVGASVRGPFMGYDFKHWSSTQRIYAPFFRRDNRYLAYVDFRVKYVCL